MKKYLTIILLFFSFASQAQTVRQLIGLNPTGNRPGFIYRDTVYNLSNTPLKYFTGYGTWGNFLDTARTAITLTTTGTSGAATYTTATGVLNIPQYAAGTGTVTNFSAGDLSPLFTTSEATTTTTPALTFSLSNAAANSIFGNFTGSSAAPTFFVPTGTPSSTTFLRGDGSWETPAGGSTGWALTGNAGTTFGTNFLGTTDNVMLMFRVNNGIAGILDSNSVSTGKTFFGVGAGAVNTATSSTGFGFKALAANTTGIGNTAVGNQALTASTTATRATAVGFGALKTLVSVADNTAVGYNALTLATAEQNTAVGSSALDALTTGTGNTAVGLNALGGSLIGVNNTAIGLNAASGNTGDNNVAIGSSSLSGAGAGAYNVAIGVISALTGNTTGNFNTAIQRGALSSNTTASNSTAIGNNSLNLSTGANNTGYGYYSGAFITSETGVMVLNGLNRTTKLGDQTASPFYFQQSLSALQQGTINGQLGIGSKPTPTAWLDLPRGHTIAGSAPLSFTAPISVTTTAATGTGGFATLTFATTTTPAFAVGSTVAIAGVEPAGYNNAAAIVTAVTATTISYANTTTAAQTVAGTITQGGPLATPVALKVENDAENLYFTNSTPTRHTLLKGLTGSATLNFGSTAAQTSAELTITVTGATDGDDVVVSPLNAAYNANSNYTARVSATNTVSVAFNNFSAGPIDPASAVFKVTVIRW